MHAAVPRETRTRESRGCIFSAHSANGDTHGRNQSSGMHDADDAGPF